jgi:hypothetical protein
MDALWKVWDFVRPHLASVGLAATWAGIALVAFRTRRDFSRKRFEVVNVSLNYVVDGKLAMRTLMEVTPKEIWLNDYGIKLVLAAAKKTTKEQPFVVLENEADMGYVKRALKNVLSEHLAVAFLAESMGVPVRKATYVYALTYEKYESIRELKFRVVVAEEKALQALFGPTAPPSAVGKERHLDRLRVLRMMAELDAGKGRVNGADVLDRVELGVIHGA